MQDVFDLDENMWEQESSVNEISGSASEIDEDAHDDEGSSSPGNADEDLDFLQGDVHVGAMESELPGSSLAFPGESEAGADGTFWQVRQRRGHTIMVRCKRCHTCKDVVELGDGTAMHSFKQHVDGRACQKRAKQNTDAAKREDLDKKQLKLTDMFSKQRSSQASIPSETPSSPDHVVASLSPSLSLGRVGSLSPSMMMNDDDDVMLIEKPGPSNTGMTFDENPCPGVALVWLGSIWTRYPWHLHQFKNLSYVVIGIGEGGQTLRICSISTLVIY
ncbi:hypothetical protein EWM64_g8558 [Hericium alpestre]|uniref:Uncharacterized protein n=1 Tax=Hericium alpestre TaxID=135208 RepID=A0A4Y9ZMG5_9AGAM|nr:hypothetical protein EWM64_g8558 [Hericium alpestre]